MSNLVTTGKPKVSGAIYRAPIGTTLPSDATTALNAAFKSLGYITEDGVSHDNSYSKETVKAWGGDIVLNNETGRGYTFGFSLMEHLSEEVQKVVFGDDNVTDKTTYTEIIATGDVGNTSCYVIERVTKDGKADRIVIPEADITAIGSVSYKDNSAIVYPVTLTPVLAKVGTDSCYFKELIEK